MISSSEININIVWTHSNPELATFGHVDNLDKV